MKITIPLTFCTLVTGIVSANDSDSRKNFQSKGFFASLLEEEFKSNTENASVESGILRGTRGKGVEKIVGKPVGRDLEHGSSKGSASTPEAPCDSLLVYYDRQEFKDNFQAIGARTGSANANVTIYDAQTDRRLAAYTEVTIAYGENDCVKNGVWTFKSNKQGKGTAQVFTTSSCLSQTDAVIGGIGPFACAEGHAMPVKRGRRSRQFYELSVCAPGC